MPRGRTQGGRERRPHAARVRRPGRKGPGMRPVRCASRRGPSIGRGRAHPSRGGGRPRRTRNGGRAARGRADPDGSLAWRGRLLREDPSPRDAVADDPSAQGCATHDDERAQHVDELEQDDERDGHLGDADRDPCRPSTSSWAHVARKQVVPPQDGEQGARDASATGRTVRDIVTFRERDNPRASR